jgi:RHS repeat-associated protein
LYSVAPETSCDKEIPCPRLSQRPIHTIFADGCTPEHTKGPIDDLSFIYNGNQILSVYDYSMDNQYFTGGQDFKDFVNLNYDDFAYDAYGNMKRDLNKGIVTIKYNCLNLPDTVQLSNGSYTSYMYDFTGDKLTSYYRTYTSSTVTIPLGSTLASNPTGFTRSTYLYTDYFDNFVFEQSCLRRYQTDDGLMINTNTSTTPTATPSFVYHYFLKDHLGNNRVVFHAANNTAVIDQVNNYYPFGMEYGEEAEEEGEQGYQNYLFSGKEFDRKFQMNTYDFGARTYSADVPVWKTPDPLAEKYYSISPYAYCANNPMRFIDPNGAEVVDANGVRITYSKETGWSSNATDDVKTVGSLMMNTEKGTEMWNAMDQAEHGITINISKDSPFQDNGSYKLGDCINTFDESGKVESSEIIIYSGAIKDHKEWVGSKIPTNERTAAVAGHEAVHATDKDNLKLQFQNENKGIKNDRAVEKTPELVEKEILKQGEEKKNGQQ